MNSSDKTLRVLIYSLFFIFIAVILPGLAGQTGDQLFFSTWARYIYLHDIKNTYESGTDYLPLYQYFLWIYAKICGSEQIIADRIMYLRLITLAFEMLSLWFVYKWIDRKTDFIILFFLNIFNIAFSYNTIVWGQVDGILACMIFIAIYYVWNKKNVLSIIWFALAMNFKLQAIIFLPIWGLLMLQNNFDKKFLKQIIVSVFVIVILEAMIVFPFVLTPGSREHLCYAVFGSVDRYPYISVFAFNFWHWFFPVDPSPGFLWKTDQTICFWGLSCKVIGLIIFFVSSFFALLPLLLHTIKRHFIKGYNQEIFDKKKLWLICAAIPLLFFFCNTQMHERYSHPAFIFLIAYAFYSKDFIPYVLMSIAYFLNLEHALKWLKLENYDTLIFDARFVAGIYLLLIVYIIIRIYRRDKKIIISAHHNILNE